MEPKLVEVLPEPTVFGDGVFERGSEVPLSSNDVNPAVRSSKPVHGDHTGVEKSHAQRKIEVTFQEQ